MKEAIKLLRLAITYAEDGAPITAINRANEAITFLRNEHERREALISTWERRDARKHAGPRKKSRGR